MAKETLKLTKQNFFNERAKEAPKAVEVFYQELKKFQDKIKWGELFSGVALNDKGELESNTQFFDIPYAFQRGFLGIFFTGFDVLVYVNPSDTKIKGYIWMVIDTITSSMAKSFLDASQTDETVFQSYLSCEIDAFRSAFLVLEERISNEGTTEADKIALN